MQHDPKRITAALLAFCITAGAMPAIEHSNVLPAAYAAETMDGGEVVQNEDMIYIEYADHIALAYCEPDGDTLIIPDTIDGKPVTEIINEAFSCDDNYYPQYGIIIKRLSSDVKKVVIPESVEYIGKYAFSGSRSEEGLREVKLPSKLKKVGDYAFAYNPSLNVCGMPETAEIGKMAFDETHYSTSDHTSIIIRDEILYTEYADHISLMYCEPDGDTLIIPDTIDGKPVTELSDGAFYKRGYIPGYATEIPELPDSVKKIVIPDGIERIGKNAFMADQRRYGLEAVILPETLKEIGDYAFYNNCKLKVYGLSENTVIGENAFHDTSFDTDTHENIPYRINKDEMLYIDYEDHIALVYCEPEGDTLTIPDTIDGKPVTEIADDAFSTRKTFSCFDENGGSNVDIPPIPKGVKKVIIPEGIERIGEVAFRGEITKPVLEEVFLPSTLKEVAIGAFIYNVDLNVYGLPENVEIGYDAFYRTRFDVNERANYIEKEDLIYKEYADHMVLYYCAPDGDTLNIPDMIDGKPVTEIAAKAFCGRYYCDVKIPALPENVTNVVIPQSVKVCEGAFAGTQLEGQVSASPAGDVNLDGKITLADSLAILQFIANEDKYPLSEQAQKNADCFNPGDGITGNDAVAVMRYDTKTVSKLPIIEK